MLCRLYVLAVLVLGVVFSGLSSAQEGFWGPDVRRLGSAINNGSWALTPSVSTDGQIMIFQAASNSRPGGHGSRDLWIATRQANGEFGAVENLSQINSSANDQQPNLSWDGSRLYFKSARGPSADIFVARWTGETYGEAAPVPGLVNTMGGEAFPVISPDGSELFFHRDGAIHLATRSDPDDPEAPFDEVVPLEDLDLAGAMEWPSSLSADGRVLFFAHTDGATFSQIYTATRGDPGFPFGPPALLPGPFSSGGVHPYVSRDWPAAGSKFWFVRCTPCEIYETTWHPDCNTNGLDDLEEISSGNVSDVDENGVPDICQPVVQRFLRGDCNDDGTVNITDVVFVLGFLFLGEGDPGCDDACDSNDDSQVNISDAITTLGVLFLGNGVIPIPGMTECGVDPTEDEVGCGEYGGCS